MSLGHKATLNTGAQIPTIGYGTWQSAPGEVSTGIYEALKAGYRHLDLAKIYQNQPEVAQGFKKAQAEFGIKREDVFITSKLWNNSHRPENVEAALDETLKELELDYLDLYLIHWPVAFKKDGDKLFPRDPANENNVHIDNEVSVVDTWKAVTKLPKSKVRAVGVSNFTVENLKAIIDATGVVPAANQIERHPLLQQNDTVVPFAKEKGIHLTAYSAFGNNNVGIPLLLENDVIKQIAQKHNATPAQVILAWSQIGGHSVIPKSVTPSRIHANFQEITIDDEDIKQIKAIGDQPKRYNIPATYNPKWDIAVFEVPEEAGATFKVNTKA